MFSNDFDIGRQSAHQFFFFPEVEEEVFFPNEEHCRRI